MPVRAHAELRAASRSDCVAALPARVQRGICDAHAQRLLRGVQRGRKALNERATMPFMRRQRRRLKVALLYALCSPWDGGVCALSLLLYVLGARGPRWHLGVAWLDVNEGSWLARRWRYSTTFGHVVLLQQIGRASCRERVLQVV